MTNTLTRRLTKGGSWRALLAALACALTLGTVAANEELVELQQDASQFVMPNANYAGQNYSPLDQINRDNVDQLQVEWTLQTGVLDSHEAQPLVIGSTMYIMTPKPNTIIAVDLEDRGTIKWTFEPEMDTQRAGALACCGAQSRGMAYGNGDLFFVTLDGQLFSIDAETGEENWSTQVANLDLGETTTANPVLIHDQLIVGNEGGERGVRGWVAAYDMETGEENWKYYNTGPAEEMGITDSFDPFYEGDQVENPGVTTWWQDSWEHGGGTSWGWITFDPELDLFYYGTSNCAPWNPDYRRNPATAPDFESYPNKYCASLIARDGTTGEMVWAYSHTPQDQWDFDEPGQNILADLEIDGEMTRVILKPARNGFFYVFDAATGEIVNDPWKYTSVNWAEDIDLETGMPIFNEDLVLYTGNTVEVCPYISGNNIQNDAYSPETGLVYFVAENVCGTIAGLRGAFEPGANYTLVNTNSVGPPEGEPYGSLVAIDPLSGEKVWTVPYSPDKGNKPVFVTGGGLVFKGNDDGRFVAYDAETGDELWSFRTGSDFRNAAMTYEGPEGEQYIAVIASRGPSSPQVGEETAPDAAARYRRSGSTLYVFGLP